MFMAVSLLCSGGWIVLDYEKLTTLLKKKLTTLPKKKYV